MYEIIWYEGLIWVIVSYIIGCISMFTYVCARLRQFGWTWGMITAKIKDDILKEKE